MQNAAEKKQFDCIVVGGGAFGLAAISAMADLGITKSILLEKKKQLGSALQKSGESILLSGKAFTGEGLLKQFHTLLKIYAVQSAVGKEVLSFTYREKEDYPYQVDVKNTESGAVSCLYGKILLLSFAKKEAPLSSGMALPKERKGSLYLADQTQSIREALEAGGKIGRQIGEKLLSQKNKFHS